MSETNTDRAAGHIRGLTPAAKALALLACLLLFTMMLVTFFDVMGRYLFFAPLPAAYEVVSLMMPAVIFCALPITVLREGHVTVDLFDAMIPSAVARVQAVLVNLVTAGALALITWRLWVKSMDDLEYGTTTDELYLPLWPFGAGMSVLCALAALAALVNAWGYATARRRRG